MEADIYICDWFRDSERLTGAVRNTALFSAVYSYKYDLSETGRDFSDDRIRHIHTYMPGKTIDLTTGEKNVSRLRYSLVIMSLYTPFSTAIVKNNPGAEIRFLDDGIATYIDHDRISIYAFPQITDPRHRLYYSIIKHGIPRFAPSMIYVYNKSIDKIPYVADIREMYPTTRWDEEFLSLVKKVFDYIGDNRYKDRMMVYLPPADVPPQTEYQENVDRLEMKLRSYNESMITRIHPRTRDFGRYEGFQIDEGRNMWELLCGEYITDRHVIIGEYSTAQFNPKIMYDKEPWLIILYKVLKKQRGENTLIAMERVINELKESYRNPGKIIVLEDASELDGILEKTGRT